MSPISSPGGTTLRIESVAPSLFSGFLYFQWVCHTFTSYQIAVCKTWRRLLIFLMWFSPGNRYTKSWLSLRRWAMVVQSEAYMCLLSQTPSKSAAAWFICEPTHWNRNDSSTGVSSHLLCIQDKSWHYSQWSCRCVLWIIPLAPLPRNQSALFRFCQDLPGFSGSTTNTITVSLLQHSSTHRHPKRAYFTVFFCSVSL